MLVPERNTFLFSGDIKPTADIFTEFRKYLLSYEYTHSYPRKKRDSFKLIRDIDNHLVVDIASTRYELTHYFGCTILYWEQAMEYGAGDSFHTGHIMGYVLNKAECLARNFGFTEAPQMCQDKVPYIHNFTMPYIGV